MKSRQISVALERCQQLSVDWLWPLKTILSNIYPGRQFCIQGSCDLSMTVMNRILSLQVIPSMHLEQYKWNLCSHHSWGGSGLTTISEHIYDIDSKHCMSWDPSFPKAVVIYQCDCLFQHWQVICDSGQKRNVFTCAGVVVVDGDFARSFSVLAHCFCFAWYRRRF